MNSLPHTHVKQTYVCQDLSDRHGSTGATYDYPRAAAVTVHSNDQGLIAL